MVKLLSRSQVMDYVRLEGLQKLTNFTAHDWDLYVLKELVDNALDADEAASGIVPGISVEMRYDGVGLSITVRNRAPFPIDYVEEIFDLEKRTSVKDYYNLPTRGAQGNALKTLLGIPYALQYHFFSNYSPQMKPLSISSGRQTVDLWLDVDEYNQQVRLRPVQRQTLARSVDGTEVYLGIFRFTQRKSRTPDALVALAQSFAIWNPHATFDFNFVIDGNVHPHRSRGDARWAGKYDLRQAAPISWYTYGEWREMLYALLQQSRLHDKPEPLLSEVIREFGFSSMPPMPAFEGHTPLSELFEGTQLNPVAARGLYDTLQQAAKAMPTPTLGAIGRDAFRKSCALPDKSDLFFYRRHAPPTNDRQCFVLEVALSANAEPGRHLITGINHTPTYRDPFQNKPLLPPGDTEPQRGLEKLLSYYNITDSTQATLAVHLIAPGVIYENYGKSAISDEPYREALTQLVAEVSQEWAEATRPPDPADELSAPARAALPAVVRDLGEGPFSENQLISALKKHLRTLDLEPIASALTEPAADRALRSVIAEYQQQAPIRGLFVQQTGRLTVPRHPTDTINVAFADQPLTDLLDAFGVRAVLVTNRPELEDLLVALHIPLRYDVALLRADGNLRAALALFAKRLMISVTSTAAAHPQALVPLWVVRDATLDAALLAGEIRHLLREQHLADGAVMDLGLHVDDAALDAAWIEYAQDAPQVDPESLRAAGLGARELDFYVTRHASARLDSLAPTHLIQWFERQIIAQGQPLKALPDESSLAAIAVDRIKDRLRGVVEHEVFTAYGMDTILGEVIAGWRAEFPDWARRIHVSLVDMLRDAPLESWKSSLDGVVDALLTQHLTPTRRKTLQNRIGRAP